MIKTRKTLVAASAALAVAVFFSGCGSSGGVGDPDEVVQDTGETATINYWTWFPPETTLTAAIDAFEDANPNITVNLRVFEDADYQKQLSLALSSGEAVDVAGVQVSAMTNSVKEYLLPVSEWEGDWIDGLNETMLAQTAEIATDGVLYSVPMGSIGSPIMYYNATMLAEAGVEVPTTSAEWKVAVDGIAAKYPDVTPVVFAGDPYWQEEMLFGIAEQNSLGLSDDIIGGDGSWEQPGMIAGLNAYKSIFDDGIVSTDVLSLTGTRPNEVFSAGQAAFYIDGSWQNSLLSQAFRENNGIALEDVGAVPLPIIDGGNPAVRALAEGGLAIPAASQHTEAAASFIEFMLSTEGADVWAQDLVLVPSLIDYELPDTVLTSTAAQEGFAAAAEVIANPTSRRDSQQDFLNAVEGNAILDVLRGEKTAEEAAAYMQEQWTSGRYPHGSEQ